MPSRPLISLLAALLAAPALAAAPKAKPAPPASASAPSPTPATAFDIDKTPPADWRALDPENTLYMDLPTGRVVIELAPAFAPNHVANIKAMVRAGYFTDSAIVRAQDNYVVQWSAPSTRLMRGGQDTLKAEFDKPIGALEKNGEPFVALPDPDTYAPQVGFSGDFPAARDPKSGRTWLTHCYAMVGAGRDEGADTGGGKELYAVIGHAPRNLDRNVTLVGRVVRGIEHLSTLPRGTGDLGFYKTEGEKTAIPRIRVAADVPPAERLPLEILRTDSSSFQAYVQSRRFRTDAWYKYSPGRVGVCNLTLPVRLRP
jgi:cyclophilin family peptidyl-prolyl cis-trans isomerase